ncbi:pyridoxamine 5'-phosphate oxidase family protein [Roseibium sp.]|uniref:pyridoxamine 5'-phosphate oxidase family protein n=1 Tax=Roseibium sp. TaxID=1936156 RepID=UPI003A980F94
MRDFKIDPEHVVSDEASLRALYEATHTLASLKCMDGLDRHAEDFIRLSSFVCIGTQGPNGSADVSPRGDAPGFVKIIDWHTLAIPDRPGNNRLDTLVNIVANPNVGMLFMIPGFDETLRINGKASIVTEPGLLEALAVNGRSPRSAIVIRIREAFLHCAKAFRRSRLWDPEHRQDRSQLPSLMQMLLDQTTGAPTDMDEMRKKDADLEAEYLKTMY